MTEDRERLINLANDAIIVRDPKSRVKSWNNGATRLYGHSSEEALGKVTHTLLNTVFPVSREETDRCLETYGKWDGKLEHLHKNGSLVIVESRQVRKTDEILEINRDITERENLITERENLTTERETLITEREEILKDVNHDLREPLNVIALCAGAESCDDNIDAAKERLKTISTEATSMADFVDDVLDIYKGVRSDEFTLGQLCAQLRAPHASSPNDATSHVVKTGTGIDLDLVLSTDRQKLLRCLSNLLGNAFKHAPGASIILQVNRTADERLMFAVTDDGPGIPVEERPKVLTTVNWQSKAAAGKGGKGRGLGIAKRFAQQLGGDLRYYNVQPSGCRFEVIVAITLGSKGA